MVTRSRSIRRHCEQRAAIMMKEILAAPIDREMHANDEKSRQ